jgi:glycogen operon protein
MIGALATRLAGSADLYQDDGREPYHGINFVTSHDGFTLADLFSYDEKHNGANGEGSDGGMDLNFSWNCGVEGPTADESISALRRRQVRNAATILLLSQGVPMILAGDERSRTQLGNNNAYCQDNETSWINWRADERQEGLLRFFRLLVEFRKRHPGLRRRSFLEAGPDGWPVIWWHGFRLNETDWSAESRCLAMHLPRSTRDDDIYVILNAHWEPHSFELPVLPGGLRWLRVVDTTLDSPRDIAEPGAEPRVVGHSYPVGPRSVVVLVGR